MSVPPDRFRRWKLIAAGCALAAAAALAGLICWNGLNAAMLRLPPDSLAENERLYRFAAWQGRMVFNARCASCHGADLQGDAANGVPNLTDGDHLFGDGRISEIEQIALYGIRSAIHRTKNHADMPAFGRRQPYSRYPVPTLTPGEMNDIVSHLEVAQGRPVDPDSALRGQRLYQEKGQCFDCHGPDLGGDGYIGAPNLGDRIWTYGDGSRAAILASIEQGRAGVSPMFRDSLSAAKIRAVSAYIHSKAPPPPAA
jgi:cytochrome c oxidase cbb3-type subunit 3